MNHYKNHIRALFIRSIELRHSLSHIKSVLLKSIETFDKTKIPEFIHGSALVITDWTGPTDNGWDLVNHTGIRKATYKDTYVQEVGNMISQECCYAYAQSFEALETFLKDCIYEKIKMDKEFCQKLKITDSTNFKRENVPGGNILFQWIKKGCNPIFNKYSSNNNKDLNFKVLWSVLQETRHAITHSNSEIKITKLKKSENHYTIFKYLFDYSEINSEKIKIVLDYHQLSIILDRVSEFGYQVFKMLCINEKLDWKILK